MILELCSYTVPDEADACRLDPAQWLSTLVKHETHLGALKVVMPKGFDVTGLGQSPEYKYHLLILQKKIIYLKFTFNWVSHIFIS